MRYDLDGLSQVITSPLFIQHIPVDLTGRQVGILVEILVDEAFIVTKIQIRLRPVVCHIDFAMLVGRHGAGIDIDVGIEFL